MNAPPEPLPRRTAVIIFLAFAGAYFLSALLRAPKPGPPMYTASAPWLMASMPMSAVRAGESSSS